METPAEYTDWIADGTFYVAPKILTQSYTILAVVDLKCVPLIYILAGSYSKISSGCYFNLGPKLRTVR